MNPSLVACTCKCGWALNPSTEIDSNFRNVMVGFNRYVNLMAGPWCPIMHRFSHKARVNVKHGGLKSIKAALSFCRCLVHNQSCQHMPPSLYRRHPLTLKKSMNALFGSGLWAGVNQPVHYRFLGGKALGIQQGTSVYVESPNPVYFYVGHRCPTIRFICD